MRSASLLFLVLSALTLRAAEVDVRPVPSWVERLEVDAAAEVPRASVRWGIHDLLADHQVRAGDGGESHFYRTVRKVLSASGVQNASELSFDFDPSFEQVVIHEIAIVRGTRRIDALDPGEVRVIDREDDAESGIYDGGRSALVFLDDVRAGDVIDYSWSVEGSNPILGGRYTDELDLSSSVPTRRLRHRILWPAAEPLQWRGAEPEISVRGSEQTFVWERLSVPALSVEDSTPEWFEPWDSVQVTEFASWREVAAWAAAMFQLDARSASETRALAQAIAARHPTREGRATAAIRFVQDEVRYLGIEMGRNSHEPRQPWATLQQRWGDCKDKTLLLVALLRELGFRADAALVSTRFQHRIEQKLPSPFVFDHVIARVSDGERTWWIDPTIADQGGTLGTIESPAYGAALVVRDDTSSVTRIRTESRGGTLVEQTYTTRAYTAPVALEMRTTWRGRDADSMRAELAALSIEDLAADRINSLAIDQPKIVASGAPVIHDNRDANVITIVEKYSIPEFWAGGDWSWYPRELDSWLTRPETMIRSMPLAFPWPLNVEQRVTFNFPEEMDVAKRHSVTESAAFRYEVTVDSNGTSVSARHSLLSKNDVIPAEDVPDHLTRLGSIASEIGLRLAPAGARPEPPAERWSGARRWLVGFAVLVVFVAVAFRLATRRRPAPEMTVLPVMTSFLPGDAPSSALRFTELAEIEAQLARRACVCGGRSLAPADVQRARYAEREMTIVVRRCESCGREQSTYFTAA